MDDASAALKSYKRLTDLEIEHMERAAKSADALQSMLKQLEAPPKTMTDSDNGLAQIFGGGDSKQG